jgi:hypothetical protein
MRRPNPAGFKPISTQRLLGVSKLARSREVRLAGDLLGAPPILIGAALAAFPELRMRELNRRKKTAPGFAVPG